MRRMNAMDTLANVLIIIGGLNWGLVGLFKFNLVDSLFGENSTLTRVIYTLVGLAAVYWIISLLAKSRDETVQHA